MVRVVAITIFVLVALIVVSHGADFIARPTQTICNNGKGKITKLIVARTSGRRRTQTTKIHVCFDNANQLTYYTKHRLARTTRGCSARTNMVWRWDGFLANPKRDYDRAAIPMDRGHLTPFCDFSDPDDRDLTFFYVNSAPQARRFNRGAWKSLENHVRSIANANNIQKVFVITGTMNNRANVHGLSHLSYPDYFFKLVIYRNSLRQLSIDVFIGINSDSAMTLPASVCQNAVQFQQMTNIFKCDDPNVFQKLPVDNSEYDINSNEV